MDWFRDFLAVMKAKKEKRKIIDEYLVTMPREQDCPLDEFQVKIVRYMVDTFGIQEETAVFLYKARMVRAIGLPQNTTAY